MQKVQMSFTVTWKGSEEAELSYLIDGGIPVPLAGHPTVGSGSITIAYLADNTGLHKIEWGLVFPNKTLEQVAAKAAIDSSAVQDLDSSDQEAQLWKSSGQAVG